MLKIVKILCYWGMWFEQLPFPKTIAMTCYYYVFAYFFLTWTYILFLATLT